MDGRQFRRVVAAAFKDEGVSRVAGEWAVRHNDVTWYVELYSARRGSPPVYDLLIGAWVSVIQPSDPGKANDCAFTFRPQPEPWTGPRILAPTEPPVTVDHLLVPLAFNFELDITDGERAQFVRDYVSALVGHLRGVRNLPQLADACRSGMQPSILFREMREAIEAAT